MTSILTNTSAMAALQTLRSVNAGLDKSQQQISSGLRVQKASDNAAYWSIATTMRSDRKAVSAVSDAIGLGAAKIDTAYAGMEATVDVLGEFRAKLVAANEKGVDKTKFQNELEQLKGQLVSTATSASFNGVNWLNTQEPQNLAILSSLPDYVTSSFIRSANGTVSVGQTKVELADISLFNLGGGGALQKDIRSLGDIGGLRNATINDRGENGYQDFTYNGPLSFGPTDSLAFTIDFDADAPSMPSPSAGTTTTAAIDQHSLMLSLGKTTISSPWEMAVAVNYALTLAGRPADVVAIGSTVRINSTTGTVGSSVNLTAVSSTLTGPTANGGMEAMQAPVYGTPALSGFSFTGPFRVYQGTTFSFELHLDDQLPVTITVDRSLVDDTLGTSDGMINNSADFVSILNAALTGNDINASASGGSILFTVAQPPNKTVGDNSLISFTDIRDNIGPAPDFDIVDVDITDPTKSLSNYLTGVDIMLRKVIAGASALGSVKTRIDMQANFAADLMGSIDKGVGRLVDTDMEEASAKLTAQQTQQQLAIQSLQIANTSTQTILSLFQ